MTDTETADHPADTAEHWGPWYWDAARDALVHLPTQVELFRPGLATGPARIERLAALAQEPWWDTHTERCWARACAELIRRGVIG
jgi:hypothetical protein